MRKRARPERNATSEVPDGRKRTGMRAFARALGYLRAHRRDAAGALLSLLLVSAATLVAPQLIRLAIDGGIARHRGATIGVAVIGLVVVALARGAFAFAQGYLAERASQGVAYDLRDALFEHLERLSFSYYDRVQTGQLITRLTNDVEQIRSFAGTGVVQMAASVVLFIGTASLLASIDPRLTLVVLATVVPIILLLGGFVRRIGPVFGQVQQRLGRLNAVLQEDLAGVRVVRAFTRESTEHARYAEVNASLLERNVAAVLAISNNFPLVFLFANLGTLAVIWVGGVQVIAHTLSLGELIAFNSYLAFLVQPLLTVGFLSAGLTRAAASSERVFEVLDAPVDVADAPDAVIAPPLAGRVEFRDVHFRYPGTDHEVLRGISFVAEPGQTVAVLGTTGSGKSSLVVLLPRFYDVTSGAVLVDGRDVRSLALDSLRRQIGIVMQDTRLFSGTVRDNIAYGRPDAPLGAVQSAARAAQADEFIQRLPHGYDTVIGERGVGLSGGQRQRIAIARALLVDPRLLILDDSTSAVDVETEAAIRAALDRLRHDRRHTVFVIAQRASSVRDADLILVLDGGRIAARGTHEELLRESELYNEIFGAQLREEREENEGGGAAPGGAT